MSRVLLAEIKAYCAATGTKSTVLGVVALNDRNLVKRLIAGRMLKPETAQRVRAAMRAHPGGMKRTRGKAGVQPVIARVVRPVADIVVNDGEAGRQRLDAVEGSRELLRAMLRLGLRMGGLPGLDAETFAVRCAAFGLSKRNAAA